MDGRDTLHDSQTTDALKESDTVDTTRMDKAAGKTKKDGETILSATWFLRGQK